MLLHLGGEVLVPMADVVLLLDARGGDEAAVTAEYLHRMRARGRLEDIAGQEPKSVVVCRDAVYLSPVSVPTLCRRAGWIPGRIT